MKTLQEFGQRLGMYDPRIDEAHQCSGWKQLKRMALEGLAPTDENLTFFHENIRALLNEHWEDIKKLEIG